MRFLGKKMCSLALAIVFSLLSVGTRAEDSGTSTCAGMVVSVAGDVTIERSGEVAPATEGFVLREGDVIVVKEGGSVSGFSPIGEPFELTGPAELRLPVSPDEGVLDRVSDWIRTQIAQWVGETRRHPLVTRTIPREWDVQTHTPAQLIPAPGGQVRPGRAIFYWSTVPGIDSYLATFVSASGEELNRLVRDRYVVLNDLTPGEEYVWKVQPAIDGWKGEAKWRSFRVMTPEEERRLERAVAGMDDLDAGVLLLSAGLHEEAICRFDAAVSTGKEPASARRWRAKAMAEIGLYREAYRDLIQSWDHE